MDNTTEQASELSAWLLSEQVSEFGVRTQLDLHRSILSTLIFTELPCSAVLHGLNEEKLSTGFPLSTATVQGLSSLVQ